MVAPPHLCARAATNSQLPTWQHNKMPGSLAIFVDEERQSFIWAPSLGRNLPYAGNRWLAARLAVRHRRKIGPIFVEPLGLARYRIVIQPPLDQPDGMQGEALSRHLADQIDARLEAWVRPRIENWYWLPYFEPDAPCPLGPPKQ